MDKQIINFTANEQSLVRTGGECHYSSNKVSYVEAHFALGQNWDSFDSVRAIWFTNFMDGVATVLDSEGICIVPTEVLKRKCKVYVNLVGSIVEDEVITDRLTSYPIVGLIVDAVAKVDGSLPAEATPSQVEQFAAAVSADADRAEAAKEELENFSVTATTLPAGSSATASYDNGVLSLGIPKGENGGFKSAPIFVEADRTSDASGALCTAVVNCPAEMFLCLIEQWGYFNANNQNKAVIRGTGQVPKQYIGKWGFRYIAATRQTSLFEVTDSNKTAGGNVPVSSDLHKVTHSLNLTTSTLAEGEMNHVRYAIDLYDDNSNVVRTILSSQVTVIRENGELSAFITPYTADADSIVEAYLLLYKNSHSAIADNFETEPTMRKYALEDGLSGTGGSFATLHGINRLIPWTDLNGEYRHLAPVLRIGNNDLITGNIIVLHEPTV